MMKTVSIDMLGIEAPGVILHPVNCKWEGGSELTRRIVKKWPVVKEDFFDYVRSHGVYGYSILGKVRVVVVDDGIAVVNMFSMTNGNGNGKEAMDYFALCKALNVVNRISWDKFMGNVMGSPVKYISSNIQNAEWWKVEKLLSVFLPDVVVVGKVC